MATKLTDRTVRDLEARAAEYTVREGGGFAVRVRPTGRKTFVFIYEINGRRRRLGLGEYPHTTLPEARTKLAEARRLLGQGHDPTDVWAQQAAIGAAERQRELDRIAAEQAAREAEARRVTVGAWCARYVDQYARPRKKSWTEDQRLLQREVVPVLGQRKLDEVKRADVVGLMEGIKSRLRAQAEAGEGRRDLTGTLANRVQAVLSKAFAYAVECGEIEHNPAAGIKAAKIKESRCERVLLDEELAWVWRTLSADLAAVPFGRDVADLLLLMLATGQRKAELLALRFDMIGADGIARWGSAVMKAGRSHMIPLPSLALNIIERRRAVSLDPSGFVFPNARDLTKPMRDESGNHAVWDWFRGAHEGKREIVRPPMKDFTPHDLRRSAATGLASMGVSRVVVNLIQAHADHSVSGIYDRHGYVDEMRTALEGWNRKIAALVSGNQVENVVPLLRSA